MRGSAIEITGDGWTVSHDLAAGVPFALSAGSGNALDIRLERVSLDDLDESMALPGKCVAHEYMDGDGVEVETVSVIPFGAEPRMSRIFEYPGDGRVVKITTDIESPTPERLSVDKLLLGGDWRRFAVVRVPEDGVLPSTLEWRGIPDERTGDALHAESAPFLSILLEDARGNTVEISTGFDLWRWRGGAEGTAETALSFDRDGALVLERSIIHPPPLEGERRPKTRLRLTWLLAWSPSPSSDTVSVDEPSLERVELAIPETVPGSAISSWNGERGLSPCPRSKSFRSGLRKSLRKTGGKLYGESLVVLEDSPLVLCDDPAHLERPGKKRLPHWTQRELLDFHFWANRHLRPKNASFALFTEKKGIFRAFPSFKHMERPTAAYALSVERKK